MTKQEILKIVACIFLIVILVFGLMVYSLLPALSDFRNSIYGTLVSLLMITGIALYVTLSNKKMPTVGKITIWAYLGLRVLLVLINLGKIEALFMFLYSVFNIVVTIYIYKTTHREYKGIWLFGAVSYLSTATIALRVEYINDDWLISFLSQSASTLDILNDSFINSANKVP